MMKELMEYFKKRAMDNLDLFKDNIDLNFIKETYKPYDKWIIKHETLDVDVILDKISKDGIKSISISEKEFLDNQKKDGDNNIY